MIQIALAIADVRRAWMPVVDVSRVSASRDAAFHRRSRFSPAFLRSTSAIEAAGSLVQITLAIAAARPASSSHGGARAMMLHFTVAIDTLPI